MITPEEIVRGYIEVDFDAVVITDHFLVGDNWYYGTGGDMADAFLEGYRRVKKVAEGTALRVLLGMELRLPGETDDLLVYGVDEEIARAVERAQLRDLRQMRKWADDNGLYVCQAHPFRWGGRPVGEKYLDGVEIFNGSRRNQSHNERALAYALKKPVRRQAGSDCHHEDEIGMAGIEVDADIRSSAELAQYLLENQPGIYIADPKQRKNFT